MSGLSAYVHQAAWVPPHLAAAARRFARLFLSACSLAWVTARCYARRALVAWRGPPPEHGPAAYRIYAFNQDPDGAAGEQGFFRELSPRAFDPATWESDVRDLTGWPAFRVEVRYVFRHKKYRMVLHQGDHCAFPPYAEPGAPACRLPKGVLSARLQGPVGSNIDADVTARVMKYQGPRGDFHAGLGLRVYVREMFPFDDHADNAVRFSHLRIMDTLARLHDLSYVDDPPVDVRPKA